MDGKDLSRLLVCDQNPMSGVAGGSQAYICSFLILILIQTKLPGYDFPAPPPKPAKAAGVATGAANQGRYQKRCPEAAVGNNVLTLDLAREASGFCP